MGKYQCNIKGHSSQISFSSREQFLDYCNKLEPLFRVFSPKVHKGLLEIWFWFQIWFEVKEKVPTRTGPVWAGEKKARLHFWDRFVWPWSNECPLIASVWTLNSADSKVSPPHCCVFKHLIMLLLSVGGLTNRNQMQMSQQDRKYWNDKWRRGESWSLLCMFNKWGSLGYRLPFLSRKTK